MENKKITHMGKLMDALTRAQIRYINERYPKVIKHMKSKIESKRQKEQGGH